MAERHVVIFFAAGLVAAALIGNAPLWDGCPAWVNGALSNLIGGGAAYIVGGEA